MDENSLAHTKWNCKYHVVFVPKFRRKVIYNHLRVNIGKIIRMLCERKGIKIYILKQKYVLIVDVKILVISIIIIGSLIGMYGSYYY